MSEQTSSSQSSDGGKNNPISIAFNMHRGTLDTTTVLGSFNLEMPLAGLSNKTKPNEYPSILLEIRDEDQMACLLRMKHLQHENILGVHFYDDADVEKNTRCVRAYTEPYTDRVSELFSPEFLVNKDTKLVPSETFQKMVSGSLHALDTIFRNDLYHGNLSWNTTLYHLDTDGNKILKLSNFAVKKNKTILECQLGDCHALVHSLEEVSLFLRDGYPDYKPETCVLLDDLARSLRTVTTESLSKMKVDNENHAFFWDDKRKKTFYAYEIPQVCDNPVFLESFRSSPSMPAMPWDAIWLNDVFLKNMKDYRKKNGIKEYDYHNLTDFIHFISGMYTHQEDLKTKIPWPSVDVAVGEKHPRLLLDLKAATEVAGLH